MRRATIVAAVALGLCVASVPGRTSAQVRAGVPLSSIAPAGMSLLWAQAPDTRDGPARVAFASMGAQSPQLVVDVWVTVDARAARRRAAAVLDTMTHELSAITALGDRAWGDAGLVVLVRDNVTVLVRALGGGRGALATAAHIDAALRAAPAGAPRPGAPSVIFASAPQVGVPVPIRVRGDVVGVHVSVDGDGYARRTRAGWVLTRTGEGPFALRVVVVDSMLRVAVVAE